MDGATPHPRRSAIAQRRGLLILAGLLFLAAAGVGAYLDWIWWQHYSGLVVTLAGAGLLLLAVLPAIVPRGRPVALLVAAIALGLLAGQNLGPSRPTLHTTAGQVTVTLSSPRASTGSAPATCAMDDGARELQVSGDPNLRLDIFPDNPATPPDIDQREFVGVHLAIGDRWEPVRADQTAIEIIIGRVEGDASETRLMADDTSILTLDRTADRGIARFEGLIRDPRAPEATGEFAELAGTVEWTCQDR